MNLLLLLWSLPILTFSQLTFCVWLCLTGDKTFTCPASAIRNIFVSLSPDPPHPFVWCCFLTESALPSCFLVVVFIILALRSNQWGSSCNSMENKVAKKPQWKYLCHFSAGLISWGFHFLVEEALSDPFSALSDHSLSNLPVISNVCYGDNEFLSPEVWVLRLPEIIWAWPQPLCRQPAPPAPWSTGSPGCVFSSKSKSVEIYQKPQIKGTLRKGEETGISSFCINERMV